MSAMRGDDDRKAVLLTTARVDVINHHGNPHTVRALIDQRSEVSLISESLVQRLHLPRSRLSMCIFGIGGSRSGVCRGRVSLTLTSKVNDAKITAVAFIVPRLSLSGHNDGTQWPHLRRLQLADPDFLANDATELLLGAECTVDRNLFELVQRFWAREKESAPCVLLTLDEQLCESMFVRSHRRTSLSRYMVQLPFASPPTSLGETRRSAERLLASMEHRCDVNTLFGDLYRAFLKEYEELQHMKLVANHLDAAT
ncbi:uncharacterized protein LOC105828279 [Monomorium pharaonis]|uniref:uncharacterized protein LOC105828279 n=1 Tax=Monomorium pharaonis TaxID=307658 RepID=UPI00063F183C|nr:uncharacterized protein LOC105828279 [Monomorium pharaonis]